VSLGYLVGDVEVHAVIPAPIDDPVYTSVVTVLVRASIHAPCEF
jgi:hypothetical protein